MKSLRSSTDDFEIRSLFGSARVELTDDSIIRGYPILFNKLSTVLYHPRIGKFRERIMPDAVDRSINSDIRALVDHDTAKILGRTRSGTLVLKKEHSGLSANIDPDLKISYASDITRSVGRGDVSGMSFRFKATEDGEDWEVGRDGIVVRSVFDMEFNEVSVVTFPAYEDTTVEVSKRSLDLFLKRREPVYNWRSKFHEIQEISRSE